MVAGFFNQGLFPVIDQCTSKKFSHGVNVGTCFNQEQCSIASNQRRNPSIHTTPSRFACSLGSLPTTYMIISWLFVLSSLVPTLIQDGTKFPGRSTPPSPLPLLKSLCTSRTNEKKVQIAIFTLRPGQALVSFLFFFCFI